MKYKGNSSYSASRVKNPFHIKLDKVIDQDYQGHEDIKLANGFSDPSMVREVSAYSICRQYMDAPRCNYARVYVNGTYSGLIRIRKTSATPSPRSISIPRIRSL